MKTDGFNRFSSGLLPVLLAAVTLGASGCGLTLSRSKTEAEALEMQNVAVTYDQVRLRMRAMVDPMCGEIERTADAIIAGTTNRSVQQGALRWKIEGVPALREATFQPDPMTAVFDTWVLCNQMADYFDRGHGKELLGEASPLAVSTCRRMEDEFARIAVEASASGDVSKMRAFAREWAAQHPIRISIAYRESALSRALEEEIRESFSLGAAAVEVVTTVDDLNRRLEIYSDQLFRQARWEVELFKSELLENVPVEKVEKLAEQAVVTADRLVSSTERTLLVAENAPTLIASEREIAIKALQDEITRTITFVQEERIAALKHLTAERIAALFELHEAITHERKALTQDVEQISLRTVDHAMWRVAQLVVVTGAVLLVAGVAALFLVRQMFFQPVRVSRNQTNTG